MSKTISSRALQLPIKRIPIMEGRSLKTIRKDGTSAVTKLKTHSVTMEVKYDELTSLPTTEIINKAADVGDELGRQTTQTVLNSMKEITQQTGNTVDAKGGRITPDIIFEMIERIEMDFDESGRPSPLHIVGPPNALSQYTAVLQQTENDPALRKRAIELLAKKREEFRDRETDRKLVD